MFAPNADGALAVGGGVLRFGVDLVDGAMRAYIEFIESGERMYIYLIWQETWTTNPLARSKFICGKIVYQRAPRDSFFLARPYAYRDGVLSVTAGAALDEFASVLPPDRIKLGCL
uniref:Uncharacterized protein n=1 Tax=Haptolina ericina TaxID=156174 RepID=A0A7S3F3Q0_9EUKA